MSLTFILPLHRSTKKKQKEITRGYKGINIQHNSKAVLVRVCTSGYKCIPGYYCNPGTTYQLVITTILPHRNTVPVSLLSGTCIPWCEIRKIG